MRLHKNQTGSAAIILLIILVLAVVGFGGYYTWHSRHIKQTVTTPTVSTPKTATKPSTPAAADSTVSWTAYSSVAGKFSLRYPATWVQPTNQDLCGDFLARDFEVGPDSSSVIKCASDGTVSQISVSSTDGDTRSDPTSTLSADSYNNITSQSITADGVVGVQKTAKAIHQQDNPGLGGLPDGTIVAIDSFYSGGITYVATYTQTPSGASGLAQNHRSIFDMMVTQTLKFQ